MTAPAHWWLELVLAVPAPVPDRHLESVSAAAEGAAGWCVARSPGGVSVTTWVSTERPVRELGRLVGLVEAWAARTLPGARPVSVRACAAAEIAAELRRPAVPALASVPDAAQILGVPRHRVQQLRAQDPAFPAPVTRVSTGPLWTVAALRAYRRRAARG